MRHHEGGAAFDKFLRQATEPGVQRVTIAGKEQPVVGAILVWGVATPEGRRAAIDHYGFADVLSVEQMLADLAHWRPTAWAQWVHTRRQWTDDLFDWMAHPVEP